MRLFRKTPVDQPKPSIHPHSRLRVIFFSLGEFVPPSTGFHPRRCCKIRARKNGRSCLRGLMRDGGRPPVPVMEFTRVFSLFSCFLGHAQCLLGSICYAYVCVGREGRIGCVLSRVDRGQCRHPPPSGVECSRGRGRRNGNKSKYKFPNFFRIGFSGSPLCEAPIESAAREGRTGRQHPRIRRSAFFYLACAHPTRVRVPPNPSNPILPPLRSIVDPWTHLHSESPRLPFLVVSCL